MGTMINHRIFGYTQWLDKTTWVCVKLGMVDRSHMKSWKVGCRPSWKSCWGQWWAWIGLGRWRQILRLLPWYRCRILSESGCLIGFPQSSLVKNGSSSISPMDVRFSSSLSVHNPWRHKSLRSCLSWKGSSFGLEETVVHLELAPCITSWRMQCDPQNWGKWWANALIASSFTIL